MGRQGEKLIINYQLPITNYQLPITHAQSPIPNPQFLINYETRC